MIDLLSADKKSDGRSDESACRRMEKGKKRRSGKRSDASPSNYRTRTLAERKEIRNSSITTPWAKKKGGKGHGLKDGRQDQILWSQKKRKPDQVSGS